MNFLSTISLDLRPGIEVFTHDNGAQQSLINLLGTFSKGELEFPRKKPSYKPWRYTI